MNTEVLRVSPEAPEAAAVARAAAVLRAGGLVAFPTETVYGLGANGLDAAAVGRIFTAKGRPAHNPVILHVASAAAARQVVVAWPQAADRLAGRFWPGPLTLVLPKHAQVPFAVTAGGPTVAVRMPAHPVARALIEAAGVPVAAPSANRSTALSPTRAEHVRAGLDGRIDLVLDGGPTSGGLESTVLDLTTDPPRLLRPGLVSPADLEAVVGPISRPVLKAAEGQPLPAPGLLARHYAPRATLVCADGDGRELLEVATRRGLPVGWLTFTAPDPAVPPGVWVVVMPNDPAAYSARLYAELHALDALGVQQIIVVLPPPTDEWLAVRDRLRRAAAS